MEAWGAVVNPYYITFITGTTKGIGQAVARKFLQDSQNTVYGLARSSSTLNSYPNYHHIQGDLLTPDCFKKINQSLKSQEIHLVVLNAGVARTSPAIPMDAQVTDATLDLNLKAQIQLLAALEPNLQKKCLIIAISSVSDRLYGEGFAAYSASKAALNAYLGTLALERPDWQIVSLLPSYVDTPLLRALPAEESVDYRTILQPSDIARAISRVVDTRASIPTGARIIVVNDALVADQENPEQLYVFNATSGKLVKV